jgi:hypothetical protein
MTIPGHEDCTGCWQCTPQQIPVGRTSRLEDRVANRRQWQAKVQPSPPTPSRPKHNAWYAHPGVRVLFMILAALLLVGTIGPLGVIILLLAIIAGSVLVIAKKGPGR